MPGMPCPSCRQEPCRCPPTMSLGLFSLPSVGPDGRGEKLFVEFEDAEGVEVVELEGENLARDR